MLIHLRSGRYTVDSHEEELLWFNLPKEVVDVGEYRGEYLLFRQSKMGILVVWVRAWNKLNMYALERINLLTIVYDPIEIEVQVV